MKYILILALLISGVAEGAKARKKSSKSKKAPTASTVKTTDKKRAVKPVPEEPVTEAPPANPYSTNTENTRMDATSSDGEQPKISHTARWTFTPRGQFWQEDIESTESGEKTFFHTQVFGISMGANRTFPMGWRRWTPFLGADFAFGTLKAQGESLGHKDSFKNQPWYALGATLGISYRHTSNSEIRIQLPLHVRTIQWKSARETLEMGQGSMFNAGFGILSATKVGGKDSFLVAGFTHLYQWRATMWTTGFEWLF